MNLHAIVKKWYIIIICAVLCAFGLYFEKSKVTTVIPQTGDMTYIRVVQFHTVPVFTANQTSTEIDLTTLMKTWSNLNDLESQIEAHYDMRKLNATWYKMADSQKMKWLGDHFRVQKIGPGLYELIIQFSKKDAKDSQYIKNNETELMDIYMSYVSRTSKLVTNDTELDIIKEVQKVNEDQVISKSTIEKKYAVIGFILGALVGVIIIMVLSARRQHH
ncbi:hypothetical protein [Acidaminococcus timonensis]|jgi:hypothetical protein|uniref:hypothetical protein n=1 Tax=Acidaminococcus timonensis TaxID=1871002 RepID=UPI003A5C1203